VIGLGPSPLLRLAGSTRADLPRRCKTVPAYHRNPSSNWLRIRHRSREYPHMPDSSRQGPGARMPESGCQRIESSHRRQESLDSSCQSPSLSPGHHPSPARSSSRGGSRMAIIFQGSMLITNSALDAHSPPSFSEEETSSVVNSPQAWDRFVDLRSTVTLWRRAQPRRPRACI
jgi:hypothetical protein